MSSELAKGSFKDLVDCALDTLLPCLGEPQICYFPAKGGSFKINAVFDDDFLEVEVDSEEFVSTQSPRVGIKLRDLPFEPTDKDRVQICERHFKVKEAREDGQGGATLFLTELNT